MTIDVEDTVRALWRALSDRDWDAVKTFLSDDCIYMDVPVGPTLAARGPDDIVKRIRIAFDPLAGYENYDGLLVANGSDVIYEHSEKWTWPTGETALLQFATVHRVQDGKVALWKDYWDMGTMLRQAPATWLEDLAGTDNSWIFDATGLV